MNNVWRKMKVGVLVSAVVCMGNLALVTGCAEDKKCDKCAERTTQKSSCSGSCSEKGHEKKAEK